VTVLLRSVLRLSPGTRDRLDELAGMASAALQREVPRSAVVRAAVGAWLDAIDDADPAQLIEAIRASLVKRGRKPQR
jgi:predicted transcriptional regulator